MKNFAEQCGFGKFMRTYEFAGLPGEQLDSTIGRRIYSMQDDLNICEYIDRTGRLKPIDVDKGINPANSIR
jgi:hypothetical protein